MRRHFIKLPNGKIWPMEEEMITACVRVPQSEIDDLDQMADALSEQATGSIAALTGFSDIDLGEGCHEVCGEVDLAGLDADDEVELLDVADLDNGNDRRETIQALQGQLGLSEAEATHAVDSLEAVYENECVRRIRGSFRAIHCPAHPEPCSYVRIVVCGLEVAYWTSDEWRDAPEEVMGAILGAAHP